jgi:2-oxoglutarate dehydrogenase E1 component
MDTRKVGQNDNLPDFSIDQKKSILRKLNEAVSFENFCTLNMWGKNVFTGRRRVNNSSLGQNGIEAKVHNGNGTSWPFEYFGKHIWQIYTRYFRRIEGKDYDKEYFGDVKYHLGLTADKQQEQEKININLAPNPSHLETVGAVIEGITRAKTSISLMIFQSNPYCSSR